MSSSFSNKKKLYLLGVAVVVVTAVTYVALSMLNTKPAIDNNWYVVGQHDVKVAVTFSGAVKPVNTVDLAFARTGTIAYVGVKVGDKVSRGTVLATLTHDDLNAQAAQAKATLDAEQAKLASLLAGPRAEDVAVSEASLSAANTVAASSILAVSDKTRDAYTTADDALHNLANGIFSNPDTVNPKLNFQLTDSRLQIPLESERTAIGAKLSAWGTGLATFATQDPDTQAKGVATNLREEITFFDMLASALSVAAVDSNNTAAMLTTYRTNVTLARTNLNVALTSVIAAQTAYDNAVAQVKVATQQLAQKKAGALPEDVTAERARVDGASAALQSINAELAKTMIVAPFGGVLTRVDGKMGAVAPANTPLFSLISGDAYQIEGYLSEVDVAKVKQGAVAQVSLDAFGAAQIFKAHVLSVDPAPTMQGGIPAYKAIVVFDDGSDPGAKPGMHANVSITVASKANVLAVPKEAVVNRLGVEYVERQNEIGTSALVPITTGLSGDFVEVLSGLSVGDKIRSYGITNTQQ